MSVVKPLGDFLETKKKLDLKAFFGVVGQQRKSSFTYHYTMQ